MSQRELLGQIQSTHFLAARVERPTPDRLMKIRRFVIIVFSLFLLLVGGAAWVGVERVEGTFEDTLARLEATDATQWVTSLETTHRPQAEANLTALVKMTTTLGKALWVIKALGACLTVSALCLLVLVLGLSQRGPIDDA